MNRKITVITGASSGIGKSCCTELLNIGNIVIGIDLNKSTINNENYIHYSIDITNENDVYKIISDINETFRNIDYLVNAAGVFSTNKTFYELELEEWNRVLSVNLTGTFLISKYISRIMIKQKYGKIVNISCIRSKIFRPNMSDYATSKAGIVALTSTMALDLAPFNIQVNAVAPGFTYTGMTEKSFDQPAIRKKSESLIPNGKIANPEEISSIVLFLLSDRANNIIGTTIFSDGGYTIQK